MALLTCDFFSEVLEVGTSMTVVLPQPTEEQIGVAGSDVATDRPRCSTSCTASPTTTPPGSATPPIERYADAAGARRRDAGRAPQLLRRRGARPPRTGPSSPRSCPRVVQSFFRVSDRPRGHLRRRALDGRVRRAQARPHPPRPVRRGRLPVRRPRPHATWSAARTAPSSSTGSSAASIRRRRRPVRAARRRRPSVPPLYVGCGTEDGLLDANERFVAAATAAGVDVTTDLRPGDHEWGLWDAMIPDVIAWLRAVAA